MMSVVPDDDVDDVVVALQDDGVCVHVHSYCGLVDCIIHHNGEDGGSAVVRVFWCVCLCICFACILRIFMLEPLLMC